MALDTIAPVAAAVSPRRSGRHAADCAEGRGPPDTACRRIVRVSAKNWPAPRTRPALVGGDRTPSAWPLTARLSSTVTAPRRGRRGRASPIGEAVSSATSRRVCAGLVHLRADLGSLACSFGRANSVLLLVDVVRHGRARKPPRRRRSASLEKSSGMTMAA